MKIRWLDDVVDKDYKAALAYLTLRLDAKRAGETVRKLRHVEIARYRANDILRAAGLQPAPRDDPAVVKNLEKIRCRNHLSPVLLMNLWAGLEIADGYHRISTVYYVDPDAMVPGRLA